MTKKKRVQLGELAPKYRFFLNPYRDARFTRCPQCDKAMKVRKHPFFIHVDPNQIIILNMSGKYCPSCDILILHKDKVEELLETALTLRDPKLIGNEYLIIGTMQRKGWKLAQRDPTQNPQKIFAYLHDFKDVLEIKSQSYGWVPADSK